LQWKLTSASTWTTVSALTATSYNLTALTASSGYSYQVQANCSGTTSAYSTASTFTTEAGGGGGCVDSNEPNNSRTTAAVITPGTAKLSQLSVSTDKDWWKFGNSSATRNIKVTLTTLPADYDLKVYRSATLLSTSQNTGTTNEQVILNNATVSSGYTAYIYGYNGAYNNTSCYTLLVQLSSTAWRTDGSTDGDVQEIELAATFENAGFGMFPNPAADQVTIEVPTEKEGTAIVNLFDVTGKRIASQNRSIEKGDNQFVFQLDGLQNGLYLVQVQQGEHTHTRKLNVQR
jgi:Secretion system C-terminal sorting domain